MNAAVEVPAVVTPRRGISSTEYSITGDLPAVFSAITKLFERYHPMGYGTYVHSISMNDDGSTYAARVSHSNSC